MYEYLTRSLYPFHRIILYAIALANDKQDLNREDFGSVISTREGMQNLALYLTSVGRYDVIFKLICCSGHRNIFELDKNVIFLCFHYRYENALGAFLYPLYGQGELPQAFSRCAAVKGALYVSMLDMNIPFFNCEN